MTTGEKIAQCRKGKGLTQAQLADMFGVTRQAVSRWESDLAFPETDTLIKLSRFFGCSTDWLLDYNAEAPYENGEEWCATDDEEERNNSYGKVIFDLKSLHLEYKSKTHIGKLPLVHINIGLGRTAKGVFAVGLMSTGIISVGLLSLGVLSLGLVCLGLLAFGCIIGGVLAAGAVSVGAIALGGLAIGLFAMGGCAVGLFACGGYAAGYYFALGNVAVGGIAVGGTNAQGSVLSVNVSQMELMKDSVYRKLEEIPAVWVVFKSWCRGLFDGVLNGIITIGNIKI